MQIELLDLGPVQIKTVNSGVSHREVRLPGDDISDLPNGIQAQINVHWTAERIAAYQSATAQTPVTYTAEQAKVEVDRQAEAERLKYITPGDGQTGVYLQKAAEARAALLDGDPQAANYPLLAASLGIDGANITAVATAVATIAATWTAVAAHIENVRLTAKKAINDGSDPDTVLAGLDWSLP